MGARPKNANEREPNAQGALPSEINSQPWWRGPGFGAIASPLLAESVSKAGSIANLDGGDGLQGVSQSQQDDKGDGNADGSKQMQNSGIQADGNYGPEHQHQQPATTVTPNVMAEFHVPHTQLELGQSIACAGYTYADLYGLMTAYGNPALVHPQLIGMPQTRMPLPLEMAEEPVYVNAKQYHGILRRRQSRAKAELENKLVKVRKPYLHESRHQHAMRRARGCGGRFLNTKKNEGNTTDADPNNTVKSGTSLLESSHSEIMPTACPGNELSASTAHALEGDCSGQQRNGILVNRPSTRAVAIQ